MSPTHNDGTTRTLGMIEVTAAEFFAALRADSRDIMPSVRNEMFSVWEDGNRREVARTFPGWKNYRDTESYWLGPELAARKAVPS